jgi:hypothetical protein
MDDGRQPDLQRRRHPLFKKKVRLPLITAGCSAIIKSVVIAFTQLPGFEELLFIFLAVMLITRV